MDKHDYHTFQPLLYQVATGLLEQPAVGHPIRDLSRGHENTRIHQDVVTASTSRRARSSSPSSSR